MERLYVLETLPETNEVIVGTKPEVMDREFRVLRVNWFLRPSEEKFRAEVKIRSQHPKAPAEIQRLADDEVKVTFEVPQEAVTGGQAAVFYEGPRVLGGGWIV
jgi:tRNA-specific 2-thiouridylase